MNAFTMKNQTVCVEKNLTGSILDIGGGGEGVIGQIYGRNVTAIDRRQDELDETNNDSVKVLMDATNLQFGDNSFDHVTSFFTLMYMSEDKQIEALSEAYRVLMPGGTLSIWDVIIPKNNSDYDVFVVELEVRIPNKSIHTGYGVGYDREYSLNHYMQVLESIGFTIKIIKGEYNTFSIICEK